MSVVWRMGIPIGRSLEMGKFIKILIAVLAYSIAAFAIVAVAFTTYNVMDVYSVDFGTAIAYVFDTIFVVAFRADTNFPCGPEGDCSLAELGRILGG